VRFRDTTLDKIADMICGNPEAGDCFVYRSSSYLTQFFYDIDFEFNHDGSTRKWWVKDRVKEILDSPHQDDQTPPDGFLRLIDRLMEIDDASDDDPDRVEALDKLNAALARERFEAFYGDDKHCYIRHAGTQKVLGISMNPHRPLTSQEQKRRDMLATFLDSASEDELIEEVLLPLFRQLGFQRITAAGHKDKALEYGKDIWMRYKLPTQHYLYFGLQVKKGKLDSAGVTKTSNANVAEIYNQLLMMLGHEIFDPETSRRVLVDHAFIVAGGEITKAARNWLGGKLDSTKRSQVMFMDRDDILNLYAVTSTDLPASCIQEEPELTDDIPF
jgi:hypothetical protein